MKGGRERGRKRGKEGNEEGREGMREGGREGETEGRGAKNIRNLAKLISTPVTNTGAPRQGACA